MEPAKPSVRLPLVGAAFAACVITSVPGAALLLGSAGVAAPDVRAAILELPVGLLAALFGALQMRAQTRRQGRWVGALTLPFVVGAVLALGAGVSLDLGTHTTAPVTFVGFAITLAAALVVAALGVLVWSLIARLANGAAASPAARPLCALWLAVAAIIHVALKGATGGPVLFGAATALLALSLAPRRAAVAALAAPALLIGLGAQWAYHSSSTRLEGRARLPLCLYAPPGIEPRESDVLAARARKMAGVADAIAIVPAASPDPSAVDLVVLPSAGRSIDPVLRRALEKDATSAPCILDDQVGQAHVTVRDPRYVPIAITARVRSAPGVDPSALRAAIERSVRETLETGGERIRTSYRGTVDLHSPLDAGAVWEEYRADGMDVGARLQQLAEGDVAVVARVQIEIVR